MLCKLCSNEMVELFQKKILNRYDISYYLCNNCKLVQTEYPYWLNEAYSDTIVSIDVGMVKRNIDYSLQISKIFNNLFHNENSIFLDYAGGYGLFVRLMRDLGFNYYRQDKYCKNLFAQKFDYVDIENNDFCAVTAFEFLEHIHDIDLSISEIFKLTNSFFFSTVTYANIDDLNNWWYLSTETGQHVSFYHNETLKYIAKKYSSKYFDLGNDLYLFSNNSQVVSILSEKMKNGFSDGIQRESLINSDYEYIQNMVGKDRL